MVVRAEYKDKNGDWDFQEHTMPDDYTPQEIRDWLRLYVGRWFGMVGIKVTVNGNKFDY